MLVFYFLLSGAERAKNISKMNGLPEMEKRRLKKSTDGKSFCYVPGRRGFKPYQRGNSVFFRKNVPQPDFQFHENGFQFIQRQVMLCVVNAEQRLVRNADLFCKFSVRKFTAFLSQEFGQLFVQIALHSMEVGKNCITYA
jgi:hypothetical protein